MKITKLFAFFYGIAVTSLVAQVGNDNPVGIAGDLETAGIVTTGGHYNSYTGNARRSVTDLRVAGAVGAYPLEFTRTSNSRYNVVVDNSYGGSGQNADFGTGGNWLHSYQWSIDPKSKATGAKPTSFNVNYPDGTGVTFTASTNGDPYYRGGKGVRDRLQVFWDNSTSGRAYVIMPDGGKIWFSIAITSCGGTCKFYNYTLQGIIDPFGQVTTVLGSVRPTDPAQQLGSTVITVTEPGGRWIKMHYFFPAAWTSLIDYVTTSDGRRVDYTYTHDQYMQNWHLNQITYFGDATLLATYTYRVDNTGSGGNDLLSTCIDPMYDGAMWKIGYTYASGTNADGTAAVYGQILSENYFDGSNVGAAVSTLAVTGTKTRKETRSDGKFQTFTYGTTTPPLLASWTDFKGIPASATYDSNGYANSFTDFNGHTNNFTNNSFTGALLTKTFPLTPGDTPPNTPRGVVSYSYGSASCADPNNKDANNPYYVCTTTDEGGHVTTYLRDTSKRVTQINYPDGGTESLQYNSFAQITSHTMRTGGVETFEYDARGLRQKYRDPYHATGNPSFWFSYDSLDRLSGITDALGSGAGDINHTTNYSHNLRGQLLTSTHPVDPGPLNGGSTDATAGQRYTITNIYNPNGTLASTTDEENHTTSFTYDDYRRLRTATTPGHNTPLTASTFYDALATGEDYTHTDPNPTWIVSPGTKKIKNTYDENYRRTSVTEAFGTSYAATTSYGYDNVGNATSIIAPNEQSGGIYSGYSTTISYDERNREMFLHDAQGTPTTINYDGAGHLASVSRSTGVATHLTTFDSYDAMNRLLQKTVKETPDPDAVTKYTYYTSGLLQTMKDPRLVALNNGEAYTYHYDLTGRQDKLTYPRPDVSGTQKTELWHYDPAGRVDTFTNRSGNILTLAYDSTSRLTTSSWNDGVTPAVTVGYDVANRPTSIVNSNATISRAYFNDNLLNTETTAYADNTPRTVSYSYDTDYNRATIQYPNGAYAFTYQYTDRNQLLTLINNNGNTNVANYTYDKNGNLTCRSLPGNNTSSTFTSDVLDRVINISHALNGTIRTFAYGYDSVGNRLWTKRDGGTGDVFSYDLNDQSTSILLNVANPDTTAAGPQTIAYDANGNRIAFSPYGTTDSYTTNNLNQYTQRNSSMANYDPNGSLSIAFDNSTYIYDAQNRLISATKGGTSQTFKYDALSRQVSRTIGNNAPVYNVYDGWELIAEYVAGSLSPSNAYLSTANGMVKNLTTNQYYYQDGLGSTSHLADSSGALLEWYRYDLQGTPLVNGDSNSHTSAFGVRHLFTGQQWYNDLGVYDLRNRFYSPDTGRFLQADPLGFDGGDTNLYRYAANNPLKFSDGLGLETAPTVMQLEIFSSYRDTMSSTEFKVWVITGGAAALLIPPVIWGLAGFGIDVGVIAIEKATSDLLHGEEFHLEKGPSSNEVVPPAPGPAPITASIDSWTIHPAWPPVDANGNLQINPATGKPYTQAEWGSPVLVTGSYSYTGINAGPGGVFSDRGSGTGGAGPVFSGAGGINLGGGRQYGTGYGMGGSVAGYSSGAYGSLLSAFLSAPGLPLLGGQGIPKGGVP